MAASSVVVDAGDRVAGGGREGGGRGGSPAGRCCRAAESRRRAWCKVGWDGGMGCDMCFVVRCDAMRFDAVQ